MTVIKEMQAGQGAQRDEDAEQIGRHQATGLVHPPQRGMNLYFSEKLGVTLEGF